MFAMIFICTFAFAQAIRVLPYNRVSDKKTVSLGDIVATDGLTPEMISALGAVKLGEAPKLGEQRVFSSAAVAHAIRIHHALRKLSFQIPHRVTVENRGYEISEGAIREKLLASW